MSVVSETPAFINQKQNSLNSLASSTAPWIIDIKYFQQAL